MPAWHVYVLRTSSSALYTGITTDVAARVEQHAAGRGAKCLRGRGPLVLVYRARLGGVGLALRVERALKALPKAQKEALTAARPTRTRLLKRLGIDVEPVAGARDAGKQDAGKQDAGKQDAGQQDAGQQDAGQRDAGQRGAGEEVVDARKPVSKRGPRRRVATPAPRVKRRPRSRNA